MTTLGAAIFLDRDGVIIENRPGYVKAWSEVEFLSGVFAALRELAQWGARIVIISNQSAVGRGIITFEKVWDIQHRIVDEIQRHGGRIDGSYLCPHHPDAGCLCRKPSPGMLQQAARELSLDLQQSWLVGDAVSDLEAARSAGARGVLVRTGRGTKQELESLTAWNDRCDVVDDLPAAVRLIAETKVSELARRSP